MKADKWEEHGPYRHLGMRLWREFLSRRQSIGGIAKLCGVSPAVVRRWLLGHDRPDDISASILAREYGHSAGYYQEV